MRSNKVILRNYQTPKPRWFERFLWWCAGADERIMVASTYYDYVKYSGIGGIVLGTGLMAGLSMGFAINIIFENIWAAIIIALLWGLLIFNLDRFIISSTGKGDGKATISWGEFWHASPRLLMALLIGFTISAPLEIYIFNKEISKHFQIQNENFANEKLGEVYRSSKISFMNSEIEDLKDEIKQHESSRANFLKLAADENRTEKGGCGPKCKEFKRLAEDEVKLIAKKTTERKEKIEKRDKIIEESKLHILNSLQEKPGLLESLIVLHNIPGAAIPVWFLRLLFVFVELAPVFFKLMLVYSGYDFLEEKAKLVVLKRQGITLKKGYFNKKASENMLNYAEFGLASGTINSSIQKLLTQEIKDINDSINPS